MTNGLQGVLADSADGRVSYTRAKWHAANLILDLEGFFLDTNERVSGGTGDLCMIIAVAIGASEFTK